MNVKCKAGSDINIDQSILTPLIVNVKKLGADKNGTYLSLFCALNPPPLTGGGEGEGETFA
jgi:hypothetical protein